MSQAYQRFSARGACPAWPAGIRAHDLLRGPGRAVRDGDVEDAPVSAIRLQPFFSPVPARLSKVRTFCSGALLRRRRASGSIATPLPSAEIASGGRPCSCSPAPAPAPAGQRSLILGPVLVEPLRVRGRGHDDLLQLPLADTDPGRGQHELVRLLIRHGPAEHLRQPLQTPGVPQRRQVQHRIAREQRPRPRDPGPVRDPPHPSPHPAASPPAGHDPARPGSAAPRRCRSPAAAGPHAPPGRPGSAGPARAAAPGPARRPALPSHPASPPGPPAPASRASPAASGPSPATTASALAASSSSPYCST